METAVCVCTYVSLSLVLWQRPPRHPLVGRWWDGIIIRRNYVYCEYLASSTSYEYIFIFIHLRMINDALCTKNLHIRMQYFFPCLLCTQACTNPFTAHFTLKIFFSQKSINFAGKLWYQVWPIHYGMLSRIVQ